MGKRLAIPTANVMRQAADALVTTLEHNGQTFDYHRLHMAADLIEYGHVIVKLWKLVTSGAGNAAMYKTRDEPLMDPTTREAVGWVPGNTLYLSTPPISDNHTRALLAHEAVHLIYDVRGIKENLWDNEALAYFVQTFILARLDESAAKKFAGPDNLALIGCLASDFYNVNPSLGAVSSAQFKGDIHFDYTAVGGKTGIANPYETLTSIISKDYPNGKNEAKLEFDGIW